ncbi:MAG TPA: ankyrin repeat domain-containing protein [Rhizomicrobium sp.]
MPVFDIPAAILRMTHSQKQLNALTISAARQGRTSLLRSALSAGADPRYDGYRALLIAARFEDRKVLDMLLPLYTTAEDAELLGDRRDPASLIAVLDPEIASLAHVRADRPVERPVPPLRQVVNA